MNVKIRKYVQWYILEMISFKNCIIVCIVLSIMSFGSLYANHISSIPDAVLYSFLGYGNGSDSISTMELIKTLVVNGIPVYIIASFLSEENRSRNLYVTMRIKSRFMWFWAMQIAIFLFLTVYTGFYVCLQIVFSILLGGGMEATVMKEVYIIGGTEMQQLFMEAAAAILLRWMELVLWQMLLICFYSRWKESASAFFAVFVLNLLNYVTLPTWYPIGISSIQRFRFDFGLSFGAVKAGGVLMICYLICFFYMKLIGIKRIFI